MTRTIFTRVVLILLCGLLLLGLSTQPIRFFRRQPSLFRFRLSRSLLRFGCGARRFQVRPLLRRLLLQTIRFRLSRGSRSLAFGNLLLAWPMVSGSDEGPVRGRDDAALLARSLQSCVHGNLGFCLSVS